MKLVEFETELGEVFVNPEQVTLLVPHGGADTWIWLSGGNHSAVKEDAATVARKLTAV